VRDPARRRPTARGVVPRFYGLFTPLPPDRNGSFARRPPKVRRPEGHSPRRDTHMLDALLLALGLGVFALMAAYAAGCDRV
jgi:hypothetical protein